MDTKLLTCKPRALQENGLMEQKLHHFAMNYKGNIEVFIEIVFDNCFVSTYTTFLIRNVRSSYMTYTMHDSVMLYSLLWTLYSVNGIHTLYMLMKTFNFSNYIVETIFRQPKMNWLPSLFTAATAWLLLLLFLTRLSAIFPLCGCLWNGTRCLAWLLIQGSNG